MEARKVFLVADDSTWMKKENELFDVTMGAFDGAEVCELIGLLALSEIEKIKNFKGGIYRDDGLGVTDLPKRDAEHILKQKITKVFKDLDLKVIVECNMKIVNFLNVTLNLKEETYSIYRKPNNEINYVSNNSNHPPTVKKNIPIAINKMVSDLSSSEEIYKKSIGIYEKALKDCGYETDFKYEKSKEKKNN